MEEAGLVEPHSHLLVHLGGVICPQKHFISVIRLALSLDCSPLPSANMFNHMSAVLVGPIRIDF